MNYEILTSKKFERDLKKLKKKHPSIRKDYENLLIKLNEDPYIGDAILGLKNRVFKVRMPSTDMKRGKRGSFRVIYYFTDERGVIYLLTIYAKAKKETIEIGKIKRILKELDL